MEDAPVLGLRAVVFDFPKTIYDAQDIMAASWRSIVTQFPIFRNVSLERFIQAAHAGMKHSRAASLNLSDFTSGEERHKYLSHGLWYTIYTELDLPAISSVDEALRLDAARREAVDVCAEIKSQISDTIETVRELGVMVGVYSNTTGDIRQSLADELNLPRTTDFGMFANCSHRDRSDFQELEDVILDNLPAEDYYVDDVQNHEILFIGIENSPEMRDARVVGIQTLVWNPLGPNTDESAADMQNVLRVIMERNAVLQEMSVLL